MNFYDNGQRDFELDSRQRAPHSGFDHYGSDEDVVSIGTWILLLILTAIPFVNIIVLLVLAFGVKNKNLQNYGKAALILAIVGLLLAILLNGCSAL